MSIWLELEREAVPSTCKSKFTRLLFIIFYGEQIMNKKCCWFSRFWSLGMELVFVMFKLKIFYFGWLILNYRELQARESLNSLEYESTMPSRPCYPCVYLVTLSIWLYTYMYIYVSYMRIVWPFWLVAVIIIISCAPGYQLSNNCFVFGDLNSNLMQSTVISCTNACRHGGFPYGITVPDL